MAFFTSRREKASRAYVLALAPLGEDWPEPGSPALRARLEAVRASFHDLTRSNLGGGGLSLLPFIERWKGRSAS